MKEVLNAPVIDDICGKKQQLIGQRTDLSRERKTVVSRVSPPWLQRPLIPCVYYSMVLKWKRNIVFNVGLFLCLFFFTFCNALLKLQNLLMFAIYGNIKYYISYIIYIDTEK